MDSTLIEMVINAAATDHILAFIVAEPRRQLARSQARDVHGLVDRPVEQAHLVWVDLVYVLLVVWVH